MSVENLLKIVFYPLITVGMIFFAAWVYATSWNMLMPALFGWMTVTKTQAYAVALFAGAMQYGTVRNADPYGTAMGLAFARLVIILLVAFIIATFFI
jgi:hypothetical protein